MLQCLTHVINLAPIAKNGVNLRMNETNKPDLDAFALPFGIWHLPFVIDYLYNDGV